MSSASSYLKKTRSNPLPGGKFKSPPQQSSFANESQDLSDVTHQPPGQQERHSPQRDCLRHQHRKMAKPGNEVTDSELLLSMASRLRLVENELLLSKREIIEKDQYIHQLEETISHLELKLRLADPELKTSEDHYLMKHCQALQKQVDEMEEFLNDYGMVWVGSGHEGKSEKSQEKGVQSSGLWHPEDSIPSDNTFAVNYEKITKNVETLNTLAGEGSLKVSKNSQRATLKEPESVPLTLYHNGIVLYQGPFRSYSESSTRQFIQDLMDGYFPSELQHRHPKGVPLSINDKRDTWFHSRESQDHFPGTGHALGGCKGPSRLLPAGWEFRNPPNGMKVTSDLPGQKLSTERLLSKLPLSVIKQGRVLEIRAGIRDIFKDDSQGVSLQLVDTPVLDELKTRLEVAEDIRPPTPSCITTIKVKAESGEQTYVLKMKYKETIGDLRNYLIKQGHMSSTSESMLKTTFPTRVLNDLSATLLDCGLVPTATIYMTKTGSPGPS